MKRAGVLAVVAFFPVIAHGQPPTAAPAAPPQPAPPAAASSPAAAGAPASPSATAAPPTPAAAPSPATSPGPEYYVEPAAPSGPAPAPPPPAAAEQVMTPPIVEPPLPGARPVFEPPVPPEPQHNAPRTALWAGARLGWFFPFGNAWAQSLPRSTTRYALDGVPWRDYVSSGPTFELDVGARFSRNYSVFLLWERAELGGGSQPNLDGGEADGGDSDFWALGIRASTDADTVGFLTEVAVGYRRARAKYDDGAEVQFTEAPLEARLGIGADVRINRWLSLSPLIAIGVGTFNTVRYVDRAGSALDLTGGDNDQDGHSWVTLALGAHFDVFASAK